GADDLIMEGPLYFTLDDAKSKNENYNYMYVSFYFVSNGGGGGILRIPEPFNSFQIISLQK
ncbi:MAG: hypothetical protein ACTSXD_11375, partial [Candidatus Heimdallarchaeaceae archaeon]